MATSSRPSSLNLIIIIAFTMPFEILKEDEKKRKKINWLKIDSKVHHVGNNIKNVTLNYLWLFKKISKKSRLKKFL